MPLDYLLHTSSTNVFLKDNLDNYKVNFSGVYTFNQTKGKGVNGSSWQCEANKNIALSFCLNHKTMSNPIDLSLWVAVVMRDWVMDILENNDVYIKWPNDIVVNEKKICGILIEKHKEYYIIGIGLNVKQTNFNNLYTATSLFKENNLKDYNLHQLVDQLINSFKINLSLLKAPDVLLNTYNEYLFGKNIGREFIINEKVIKGIIKEVDRDGLLNIQFNNTIERFRMKEISFIL
ncbi:biotin--[acetyl-CoA-carboxylase] ligase [Apibacter muscae]|uniref:Biotin--[acetyl-CoA-carboxylase] ligase n=1 Tax=Apibacter muscae TaxID=2509004 RepID=A0A563DFS5_9FLAO|nr:biotin--[acetyl-CoA-carboxylase] ligase [Apibacter muscae]TWP29138.1 biotin--[acetyl-CoA-carboxylase] ligase [Apibacter muscae]TWP30281.1 biotin--[acetyl-CoA-carboxylase] ligase [Apibacter muscae]